MIKDFEKAWRERVVKSNLDLIILKFLKIKDRWGYEINLEIKDKFGVYLSAGTLYPLLHSLEDDGFVVGVWEAEKGRGRRIYKITDKGEEFLTAGEKVLSSSLKRLGVGPEQ